LHSAVVLQFCLQGEQEPGQKDLRVMFAKLDLLIFDSRGRENPSFS